MSRRGVGVTAHNKKRAKSYGDSAMKQKRKAIERIKNGEPHYAVPWVDVQATGVDVRV